MTIAVWVPHAPHSPLLTCLPLRAAFSGPVYLTAGGKDVQFFLHQKSFNSLLKAKAFHKQPQIKLKNSLT